jgi:hypothetical protein
MRGSNVAQRALPVGSAGHGKSMPQRSAGYVDHPFSERRFLEDLWTKIVTVFRACRMHQAVPICGRSIHQRPGRTPPQPGRGQGNWLTPLPATILTSLDAILSCSSGFPGDTRRCSGLYDFRFSTSPKMQRT